MDSVNGERVGVTKRVFLRSQSESESDFLGSTKVKC